MSNAPCYTCVKRSQICHAQCKEYHDWTAALRDERAAGRITADADAHTKRTIEINTKRAKTKRRIGQR